MPVEAVFFFAIINRITQKLAKHVKVHAVFGESFRKDLLERLQIFVYYIEASSCSVNCSIFVTNHYPITFSIASKTNIGAIEDAI